MSTPSYTCTTNVCVIQSTLSGCRKLMSVKWLAGQDAGEGNDKAIADTNEKRKGTPFTIKID